MKERLRAQVDGAVLALRLADLHRFADPELLGTYFYRGNIRFRRATVLRQTVLGRYIKDPDCLTETLAGRAGELLDLIVRCSEAGAHPHLAPFASLYRRAFHAEYLAGPVGANLVFAALEGLLGRFRPPGAKPQLEDLVECLAPEEPAAWFHAHGRRLRNDAAHGRWTGEDTETLGPLWSVLGAVLETYLRFLVEAPQHAERPARAFREQVESWI